MNKVYIQTRAYNEGNILRRAIESVLNQTHSDFIYYICDNGSTDGGITRSIVEEYAKLDNRIKPFFNEINRVWTGNEEFYNLTCNINEKDYYCMLDADDEYMPTFLEESLGFMNDYNLDIAISGNSFIDVLNGESRALRVLPKNLILEGVGFSEFFPVYHQFMRTIWGKLFRGCTLHNVSFEACSQRIGYGGDTIFTFQALRNSNRVGILAKSLHKYYISPNSNSYRLDPRRVHSDRILYEDAVDYLEQFGSLSKSNKDFLLIVYYFGLLDTINVLFKANEDISFKFSFVREILTNKITIEVFTSNAINRKQKENLAEFIINWCLSQPEKSNPDCIAKIYDIFKIFNAGFAGILTIDRFRWFINFPTKILKYIALSRYAEALNAVCELEKKHEYIYELAQVLSAITENSDQYIRYSKLLIGWYIKNKRFEEAKQNLIEFEAILPDDEDLKMMRKKLENHAAM